MIRPGPTSIAPGLVPGGVVIHVYAAALPPVLLVVRRIGPADDVDLAAVADAITADRWPGSVCLVGYDGDSGERFEPDAWFGRTIHDN